MQIKLFLKFTISFFIVCLLVLSGPAGYKRRNDGVTPFAKLKKDELVNECHWRSLPAGDLKKTELEKNLKEHLAGICRVPPLMFHNQNKALKDCNLDSYEVLPSESLHDTGHIKNLWEDLPYKLQENELAYFNQVKEALLYYKDKLRGCDYRLSGIVMYKHMEGRCRSKVQELLYTLAQILEPLYI